MLVRVRRKMQDIQVEEYTSPDPVTVGRKTTVQEIAKVMRKHHFRHVPVVEGGRAIGIISDRDLGLVNDVPPGETATAEDVMTALPYTVTLTTSLEEVCFELSRRKVGSAIVTEADGKLYGIFTSTDALNALVEVLRGDEDEKAASGCCGKCS